MKRPSGSGPRRKKSEQDDQREKCFVMMPFSALPRTYYDKVYAPAVEAAGLRPIRVDDIYLASPIIRDIWREVREARVMIADLTLRNPNVMYELGLAHAIGKPVVMLAQSLADVPFDLQSYRVITYQPLEPDWADTLRGVITRTLRDVLRVPSKWVLPAFLQERDVQGSPQVSPNEKRLAQVERALERLEARERPLAVPSLARPYIPALASTVYQVGAGVSIPAWLRSISTTGVDPLEAYWTAGWTGLTEEQRLAAIRRALSDPRRTGDTSGPADETEKPEA